MSNSLHPGRLTWNLQIPHLERKVVFQTSMIMFHVHLQGCVWNLPLCDIHEVPHLFQTSQVHSCLHHHGTIGAQLRLARRWRANVMICIIHNIIRLLCWIKSKSTNNTSYMCRYTCIMFAYKNIMYVYSNAEIVHLNVCIYIYTYHVSIMHVNICHVCKYISCKYINTCHVCKYWHIYVYKWNIHMNET